MPRGLATTCLLLWLAMASLSCAPGGEGGPSLEQRAVPTGSTVPELGTTPTSSTDGTQRPQNWIAVQDGRFVDTRSGQPFVPRGVNLLRKPGGGGRDQLFADYDIDWIDDQLEAIADRGFNTVRFFLDQCMTCTATSDGIRADHLDHLDEVLTRIEAHGLVAVPTSNDVPDPGYSERLPCCTPFGGYRNSLYLSAEGHAIAVEYWTDLIEGLRDRGTPTHHVLGWELVNEHFVLRDVEPLSSTTGTVATADGRTWDLADDDAVAELVRSNLRAYIDTVGATIRALDDGALVTIGFFAAAEPLAGRVADDPRWVVADEVLTGSSLDFLDLHAYPGLGGNWDVVGPGFDLGPDRLVADLPLLLGEFGAFEDAYPDPADGAAAIARYQAESCAWGFSGWLVWFWGADADDEVHPADANGGIVADAVSPLVRPDPCAVGPYESANLALGRPAVASATESSAYPPAHVTDGSEATWWSAAAEPPQWVEIDLGADRSVGRVAILIGEVSTTGPQTHRVHVRGADEPAPGTLVGEVSADAVPGDWLTVEFPSTPGVRTVRVETVAADGWVILHEITVES